MIFLISTGTAGLSFLSRPTTFLRDQKRSWRASVCIAKGPRLSRYPFPLPLAFRLLALFYRRYASPFPFRSRLFLTDEAASRYNGLSFRRYKKILFFLFFNELEREDAKRNLRREWQDLKLRVERTRSPSKHGVNKRV